MSDHRDPSRRSVLGSLAAAGVSLLFSPSSSAGPALRTSSPGTGSAAGTKAYINFVINVQNFRYLSSSVDTVGKLCSTFAKYGVKGDFYLTGPMAQLYNKSNPEIFTKLKGQGICYHSRPPHAIFTGFEGKLEGLSGDQLTSRINDFETQYLDLETGQLDSSKSGGFALVTSLLGKAPSCVAVPTSNDTIKAAACQWYKDNGAKAVVWYHKAQDLGSNPYQTKNGLLSRPSDIVVEQWKASGESGSTLWWNRYSSGYPGADGKPHNYIEQKVGTWQGKRAPFVTVLIHDNNFTRKGPDPWLNTFWKDKEKTNPRSAPFDLEATDPSSRRSDEEQSRILQAYGNMVEFCAQNYNVVTMADICTMAGV
mgnify:CR=1 FL=1